MLLVQEHLVKLGGVKLSGQMKSIDITETATIEDIEDDKGKTKANQPTGYEAAKITIEFILEDSPDMTQTEQITAMQRLFKPYGQTKAKLLQIYNEDCTARGISKVYFQKLESKNVVSESGRTATLELLAPVTAGITLKTKKETTSSSTGTTSTTTTRSSTKTVKKIKAKSPASKIVNVSGALKMSQAMVRL
jgi:hypothetical protein